MTRVFIIAEAGVNHNGQMDLAFKLIDAAVEAGADAVKFQTAVPELVMIKNASKAEYQLSTTRANETQLEMAKRIHLPLESYKSLKEYSERAGIIFLSTPFDIASIDLLNELELYCFKIPSGEITNLPYLRKIGRFDKEVILSTGMADLSEIKSALNILISAGTKKQYITVLHCNTEYPTPFEDVNLNAMVTIRKELDVKVGYSDHTYGIEVPIAAVAMGAEVIEKHFTLDRDMEGPDHKASVEPAELKAMVNAIRNIERSLGDDIKKSTPSEQKNIFIVRKSVVAARKIKAGDLFSEENLTVKRPGTGISPMRWDEILGTRATMDYDADELIEI